MTANTATTGVEVLTGNFTTLTDIYVSGVTNGVVLAQAPSVVFNKFKASNSVTTAIGMTTSSTTQSISITGSNIYARTGFSYVNSASLSAITISNSVFQSQVVGSRGVFISVSQADGFNLAINNCSFTDYSVLTGTSYSGAAVYVSASASMQANITVVSTTFTNNRGQNGPSLYAFGLNEVFLSELTVFNSISSTSGGGFYLGSNFDVKILDSEFKNCSATGSGTSSGSGGAVYFNAANVNVLVANSTFSNNSATVSYGGAIYFPYSATGLLTIENCVLNENYAGQTGGAIASYGAFFMKNSTVSSNSALSYGAGIYYANSQGTTISYILYSNFDHNSASNGGAIYSSSGYITLDNATFTYNSASSLGGAIYAAYTTFSLYEATFQENSASGASGGGMYITSYSSLNVVASGFIQNSASNSGGGFYCNSNAGVLLNNVVFNGNTASSGSAYVCSACLVTTTSVYVNPDNTVSCVSQ